MDGFQVRFSKALHSKIEEMISEKSSALSSSVAPDYPSYTERVGFIKGLRAVLQEMKDVEVSLSAPEETRVPQRVRTKGYEI